MESPFLNIEQDIIGMPSDEQSPDLVPIEELEDGGMIFDIEGGPMMEGGDEELPPAFDRNLAEEIDDSVLNSIVSDLLEKIDDDLAARKGWEAAIEKGMLYLGLKVEVTRDYPFASACSAYDCTLSTALFRGWATARAELFPQEGPCRSQILGAKSAQAEEQGERLKAWMNYYLTRGDKDYYPDSIRMLLYVFLAGTTVKKVYQSPLKHLPISRFIDPQDFIVEAEATSIFSASRLTHRMTKTKKELMLLMLSGFYKKVDLETVTDDLMNVNDVNKTVKSLEGVSSTLLDVKKNLTVYEVHADLDIEGFEHTDEDGNTTGMPLPYIVTILVGERKGLSIRRNWAENDPCFDREECFVDFNMLPGFGVYGIGYAQLLGSNAIALTSILRQLIDKGTLCNFPGGVRVKGLRIEENDLNIGPSEFREIETGGMPIKDAIMPMPYNEPSSVLKALREGLRDDTQQLAATAELQIADMNNETPVGTTMAMLEVQTKVQSSVMRGLHMSLSRELELIYDLFAKGLTEDPGMLNVPGMSHFIKKEDFNDLIRIVPVSDPNLTTNTQRMMHAEAILRIADSHPELHNMRDALFRMYKAMNVEDIESLLPPEDDIPSLDPISENMRAMKGEPLKAAIYQDQDAHINVHETFSLQNPDIEALKAHIHEHRAFKYLLEMQNALGMELPSLEELQNPEIQNAIAMQAAQITSQQNAQAAEANPQPIDPGMVMLEEVKQKDRAAQLKNEEAKLRAESEAFKATMKHEEELEKIEAELEMAKEKNENDMAIAELKFEEATLRTDAQLAVQREKTHLDNHAKREAAHLSANSKSKQGEKND